jgi:DNA-binding Xre family transcriptional regulator
MIGENHHRQYTTGENPMIDFGKCLIKAQTVKAISSAELARTIGVHRQQINIWRNKKNVRLDTLIKVCNALDMPVELFLFNEI